jgi:hypothetical protein
MTRPPRWRRTLARWIDPPARSRFSASAVSERNVAQGADWSGLYRDRYDYDRLRLVEKSILAWRMNPLARRIVELQTQYLLDGIEFRCDHPATAQFLKEFWNHALNRIGERLEEWATELALTGNLFVLLTTDASGMSYLRIQPSDLIEDIETAPNDVQQERAFLPKASASDPDPKPIPRYWATRRKSPRLVMLHYAVNRLAGTLWGEPDLAPLLPWLSRYAQWLEDRMRLNRFRQAYMYVVRGEFASEEERQARQAQVANDPPAPGAVLVINSDEEWSVISPQLDSFEANNDGLALKKFIIGGRGYPLHWLAEPESSTRATAEAAGTPTFKTLEARQRMFLAMLQDILTVAVQRRAARDQSVDPHVVVTVNAADISERDNAALALASTQVVESFGQLWANGFIDADEYLRVVYRFAGEVLPAARPDNPQRRAEPGSKARPNRYLKTDAASGAVNVESPDD